MATIPQKALPKFSRSNYGDVARITEDIIYVSSPFEGMVKNISAKKALRLEKEKENATAAAKAQQDQIKYRLDYYNTRSEEINKNLSESNLNNTQLRDLIANYLDTEANYAAMANNIAYTNEQRLDFQREQEKYSNQIENLQGMVPALQGAMALTLKSFGEDINDVGSEGGATTVGGGKGRAKIDNAMITMSTGIGTDFKQEFFYNPAANGMAIRISSKEILEEYGEPLVVNQADLMNYVPNTVPEDTKELKADLEGKDGSGILKNGGLNIDKYRLPATQQTITIAGKKAVRNVERFDNAQAKADMAQIVNAFAQGRLSNQSAQLSYQNTLLPLVGEETINLTSVISALENSELSADAELLERYKKINGKTFKKGLPELLQGDGNIGKSLYDEVSQVVYEQALQRFADNKFGVAQPAKYSALKFIPGQKGGNKLEKLDLRKLQLVQDFQDAVAAVADLGNLKLDPASAPGEVFPLLTAPNMKKTIKGSDAVKILQRFNIPAQITQNGMLAVGDGSVDSKTKKYKTTESLAFKQQPNLYGVLEAYRSTLPAGEKNEFDQVLEALNIYTKPESKPELPTSN